MSIGLKLGSKIAALDHEIFLETCEGKSHALMAADAYRKICTRERMPVEIRVRKAYNRGCYSLFVVPNKAA